MKKVLIFASLAFAALSFSCGGGSDTPAVANVETAAGMSSIIFSVAGGNIFTSSVNVDELMDTVNCPINGTIAVELTVTDANSGAIKLTYDKCGAALCDGHIFMNGTFNDNYSVDGVNYTYNMSGTINFITAAEAEWDVPGALVYYAGQSCAIDLAMNINTTDADALTTAAEIAAYIDSHMSGTICGYNWADAVALDVNTEDLSGTYCTDLAI